jgi:hypothetical protein
MTPAVSMSVFHQWLLADPANKSSACAIVLHVPESQPCDELIFEITDHLNEYDDDGDGRWLPAYPLLVEKISKDSNHRRLLGLDELPPTPADDTRATFRALGQRGHIVLRSPSETQEVADIDNAFHAGIGRPAEISSNCHFILNPELMDRNCIAHVIGDVFLEWLHHQSQRREKLRRDCQDTHPLSENTPCQSAALRVSSPTTQ